MRLPMRVSEIVEFGSMGTGTTTRSRQDVDLIVFSQGYILTLMLVCL